MKKLTTTIATFVAGIITSGTVFAHSGHINNESVHGLLHAEHITVFVAVIFIAFAGYILRKK